MAEKIEKLVSKIKENRNGLFIARIPAKTREEFIALANEEFCDDYGMTLKWLMDGILTKDATILLERIERLEGMINEMQTKEPEKKTRRMLSGREIQVKK